MKSLLELIGVAEFERAATRAVRRAANETLAAGGTYLGLTNGRIVKVSRVNGKKVITPVKKSRGGSSGQSDLEI